LEATKPISQPKTPSPPGSMRPAPARREHGTVNGAIRVVEQLANSAGEHRGSIKRFSQALESRGLTRVRQRRGGGNPVVGFDGLRRFRSPNRRGTIDERRVCAGCAASGGYPLMRARVCECLIQTPGTSGTDRPEAPGDDPPRRRSPVSHRGRDRHEGGRQLARLAGGGIYLGKIRPSRPDPLFGQPRYWPAVRSFLDRRAGMALTLAPLTRDGEEKWDDDRGRKSRARP
jgi:hypothetical protein